MLGLTIDFDPDHVKHKSWPNPNENQEIRLSDGISEKCLKTLVLNLIHGRQSG